jgi:hypothetical protein
MLVRELFAERAPEVERNCRRTELDFREAS